MHVARRLIPEMHVRSGGHPAQHPGLGLIYSMSAKRGICSHLYFGEVEHQGDFLELAVIFLEWLKVYNQMVMAL